MKKQLSYFFPLIILIIFFAFILLNFYGINNIIKSSNDENLGALQKSIENAAIQCYALEGHYPPNIKYLEDNYMISINSDAYIYHYEIEASNIMPTIIIYKNWRD